MLVWFVVSRHRVCPSAATHTGIFSSCHPIRWLTFSAPKFPNTPPSLVVVGRRAMLTACRTYTDSPVRNTVASARKRSKFCFDDSRCLDGTEEKLQCKHPHKNPSSRFALRCHPDRSTTSTPTTNNMPRSGTNSQGNHYNTPGGSNSNGGSSYHCKF